MQKHQAGKRTKAANHSANSSQTKDEILEEIAALARIDDRCHAKFRRALSIRIVQANESATAKGLRSIKLSAGVLRIDKAFGRIERLLVTTEPEIIDYIDAILSSRRQKEARVISDVQELKAAISATAQDTKQTIRKGRPGGLRTPFDVFVFFLIKNARSNGGELTIYKNSHAAGGWDGRLLKSVNLLRPLLNEALLPKGSLGQTLHRIAERPTLKPQKST
ncbi:hypothetical protein ABIF70_006749 [Bradyrhizobium japonicum]